MSKREREALVRIAGTPTKNSSEEARLMARAASEALARPGVWARFRAWLVSWKVER